MYADVEEISYLFYMICVVENESTAYAELVCAQVVRVNESNAKVVVVPRSLHGVV